MKKLYYALENNDVLNIVCESLEVDVVGIIKSQLADAKEDHIFPTYTITPVWLEEEEYNNLPEA